eukprot:CAMPEP_0172196650 /NCGR_PEP_ID=MMETSP1050-20130122/26954_1 /TAXON_ID=233186 /ORGANISM="Cryptomonas curvata, Strain CCAP979/52" /LENGTH=73 /DNA_ID=CAMNT_0012872993 /DNA_START=179 /DNA_END=397 /DNA_ORIENTATION=-
MPDGRKIPIVWDRADLAPGSSPDHISLAHLISPSAETTSNLTSLVAQRACRRCSSATNLKRCSHCKAAFYCSS